MPALRLLFGRWRGFTARAEDRWLRIKTEALIVSRAPTQQDDGHWYVPLAYGQARCSDNCGRPSQTSSWMSDVGLVVSLPLPRDFV